MDAHGLATRTASVVAPPSFLRTKVLGANAQRLRFGTRRLGSKSKGELGQPCNPSMIEVRQLRYNNKIVAMVYGVSRVVCVVCTVELKVG
eukprot:scaffold232840_cov27-Tisochrysis_lutea.AAC.4